MSFSIPVILQYKSDFFPLEVLHMVAMEMRINYITQERERPISKPSRALNDFNYWVVGKS